MRALGYLGLLAVAVTGPALYFTVGADARARRNTAARAAVAERREVDALLAANAPPSDADLREIEAVLAERQHAVQALLDGVATAQAAPSPSIEALRGLTQELALDPPVVEALLAGAETDEASATIRRHVLGSVLGVLSDKMQVERMRCASQAAPIDGLPLEAWRIDLAFVAPLVIVEHTVEALCGGDLMRSPARIVALKLTHTRPDEWAELSSRFEQPPVRFECSVDVLRATRSAP